MDNTAALGGFHSLCGDRRTLEFPGAVTTPKRTTTGASGQAATVARTTARVCSEKRRQSCTRRSLLGDHWRRRAAGGRCGGCLRTWDTPAEYAVSHSSHGRADAIIVLLWELCIAMRRIDVPVLFVFSFLVEHDGVLCGRAKHPVRLTIRTCWSNRDRQPRVVSHSRLLWSTLVCPLRLALVIGQAHIHNPP